MMLLVALTTLLLSAGKMVFGHVDDHFPNPILIPRDDTPVIETGWCLIRTFADVWCYGEERNGFLLKAEGCKPCGNVEGPFLSISFMGTCPDGILALYTETTCGGNGTDFPFKHIRNGGNEYCYTVNKPEGQEGFNSLQACFIGFDAPIPSTIGATPAVQTIPPPSPPLFTFGSNPPVTSATVMPPRPDDPTNMPGMPHDAIKTSSPEA